MRTEQYTTGGRTFEIPTANFGEWIAVQAFENGKPASLRYDVTVETAVDMERQNGDSAVEALIEIMKSDLDGNQ